MIEFSCLHGNEKYEACDDAAIIPYTNIGLPPIWRGQSE